MRLPRWRAKPESASQGYDDKLLIDVIIRKTAAIRDAARIDDVIPGEAVLPTITAIAAADTAGPLHVLDFGGGAGLHYFVARQAFPQRQFRWAVAETPSMATGASRFADGRLCFFTSIDEAAHWLGGIGLIHCVSALQYVPEPEATLHGLVTLGASSMLWAKLMLGDRREQFAQTSRLRDNGPGPLPPGVADRSVIYSGIRVARGTFLDAHRAAGYRLVWKAAETDSFLFAK